MNDVEKIMSQALNPGKRDNTSALIMYSRKCMKMSNRKVIVMVSDCLHRIRLKCRDQAPL